jgi:hypothetical protein
LCSSNVVFVAPLLAIAAIRYSARARRRWYLARLRHELHRRTATLVPALLPFVAALLILLGGIRSLPA